MEKNDNLALLLQSHIIHSLCSNIMYFQCIFCNKAVYIYEQVQASFANSPAPLLIVHVAFHKQTCLPREMLLQDDFVRE